MLEDIFRLAKSIAFHGMDSDDIDNNLDDCDDYDDCGEDYDTDGCYNPSFTGNPPEVIAMAIFQMAK